LITNDIVTPKALTISLYSIPTVVCGHSVLISDISAIIDKIRTASPISKIYVISILPVRDTFSCALIERYNNQIESLCNSKNVKFISVYNLFKTSGGINETYYQADGVHLNQAGYQVYADAIRSHVLSG